MQLTTRCKGVRLCSECGLKGANFHRIVDAPTGRLYHVCPECYEAIRQKDDILEKVKPIVNQCQQCGRSFSVLTFVKIPGNYAGRLLCSRCIQEKPTAPFKDLHLEVGNQVVVDGMKAQVIQQYTQETIYLIKFTETGAHRMVPLSAIRKGS